jgi:phosphohistidine swiveling domain-containing protein/sulfatase maturation enzyme AslB (radical SAM superfamily)
MLGDVREMQRLRNERGIYSDLWAIGILRHAFLEAGRRLTQKGTINSPELALDASPQELIALLRGNHTVSSAELRRRIAYRSYYSVTDTPAILGPSPANPPDLSHLPPSMARTMAGLITAITLAVEHVRHEAKQPDILVGTPASRGIVEGTARVILSDDQVKEIKRGDILVVYQTTAAFNIVFSLIGGIISQFGGVLSHPAILAREHGIPCVVGCSDAMERLRTGMRIRLDGNKGEVKTIPEDGGFTRRLESLRCAYYGPMQGRNRDRVFNHLEAVSAKLSIVEKIRKDERCLGILRSHFKGEISTDKAADQIIKHLKQASIKVSRKLLKGFAQRYHIEFHPCDACNLRCNGCTYFQDISSRPSAVSFPFDQVARICSLFQPRAITIVGGGEPTLYRSGQHKLGDLICALGQGKLGCAPAIGLISNGVSWPPGNQQWPHYVKWVRYSLDASTPDSYVRKGKNYFDKVIDNVFRTLTQTDIPLVGVGFLYHPGNIAEAGPLISFLAHRLRRTCPDQLHRLNVQFRPWRVPTGRPSIQERILSDGDIEQASAILLNHIEQDSFVEQFARHNTNIAVNLLCGGAREKVELFSECLFGLAKTVVRANGSLYPCFRMAASSDPQFYCGNILVDRPLKIALKELYITLFSARQVCVFDYAKCLFCVFNNALDAGLTGKSQPRPELTGDYFF